MRAPEQALPDIQKLIKTGHAAQAFTALRRLADPWDGYAAQSKYARLCQRIPASAVELRPLKVALLGSATTEHFADILRMWLAFEGFAAEIWQPAYGVFRQEILDPASELYTFAPDVVWLFTGHRDVSIDVAPGAGLSEIGAAVARQLDDFERLWTVLKSRTPAQILQNNADLPPVRDLGNFDGGVGWGRTSLLRRFNVDLAERAGRGVTIFDLDHLAATFGRRLWDDSRYWYHSKHAFALDACGIVAFQGARVLGALKGLAKKCLVLDLDNTLWGGVIGDDGIDGIRLGDGADGEAFAGFQSYVRRLKNRGVILTVCSKNEMENAVGPFERHPNMSLKLEDIAVFKANWSSKVDNIREIAQQLNIGLDALVFVDDNPAERDLVRAHLPQVAVPEMPEDPAEYINVLERGAFFEMVSFSDEDLVRNKMYRENATRAEFEKSFTDISSYLASLEMVATVGDVDDLNIGRSSQLINKSNQFHLTGTRYSEAELRALRDQPGVVTRQFRLADRFGDNGLISVVILRAGEPGEAVIDTWVMSCRVLSRGMEEFICRELETAATAGGFRRLVGSYVPSKKNGLVAGLYGRLGFDRLPDGPGGITHWAVDLPSRRARPELFIRDSRHTGAVTLQGDH